MRAPAGRGRMWATVAGMVLGAAVVGLGLPALIGDDGAPTRTATAGDRASGPATGSSTPVVGPSGAAGSAASASGGAGPAGAGAAVRGNGAPAGTLRASDTGVTATTVKIGFSVYGVGSAARLGIPGLPDPTILQAGWQAMVDDLNARGGVAGRKIVPVFRVWDVSSEDEARAACLYFTEEQKVFAVVGSFATFPAVDLCVAHEHATPMITHDVLTDLQMAQTQGRFFTLFQRPERLMANFAVELDRIGALKGRTIGILTAEGGGDEVASVLDRDLGRAGYHVARTEVLSSDLQTAASQIPVSVSQMRTAGVDLIVLLVETIVRGPAFIEAADRQGYRPHYAASDYAGAAYIELGTGNAPDSFAGAVGITSTATSLWIEGAPERPAERSCREIYEHQSGRTMPPRGGDSNYGALIEQCDEVRLLAAALAEGDPSRLTRATLITGAETFGAFDSAYGAAGSFRPGKHDFFDQQRVHVWRVDCKCFRPVDAFRPSRY